VQEWLLAAQSINKNISWTGILRVGSDTPHCLLFAPVTRGFCDYANSAKWLQCKMRFSERRCCWRFKSSRSIRRVAEWSRHFEGSFFVHLQGQAVERDESTVILPNVGDYTAKDRVWRPGRTESSLTATNFAAWWGVSTGLMLGILVF